MQKMQFIYNVNSNRSKNHKNHKKDDDITYHHIA